LDTLTWKATEVLERISVLW